MPHTGWVFWQAKFKAQADAPQEWQAMSHQLRTALPREIIEKIELISFLQKGSRIARWKLGRSDPDYCTVSDAIRVAKKLAWLALTSKEPPDVPIALRPVLRCENTATCTQLEGHDGACNNTGSWTFDKTRCDLCGRRIEFEDFDRDGRRDPESVTVAHRSPLSRAIRQHNSRNVSWAHRSCNQMQGEQSVDEALEKMRSILMVHGYVVNLPARP